MDLAARRGAGVGAAAAAAGPGPVLVGIPAPEHLGAHLVCGARELGLTLPVVDSRLATSRSPMRRRLDWHLRGHRLTHLRRFGQDLVQRCRSAPPTTVLATGLAPLDRRVLEELGRLGVRRINFLTDDPWNPAHRAEWFFRALVAYDVIFTPRAGNIAELVAHGCRRVEYLPFGYSPQAHYPEAPRDPAEAARLASDVLFVGGADPDRLPYVQALLAAHVKVGLYGGGWERFPEVRALARGILAPGEVRRAVGAAKVNLCLVRRANRDGHSMRSYELPAMGACILAEDTDDHRRLFGDDGVAVLYFRSASEMLGRLTTLLADEALRARLGTAARAAVTSRPNTYADRLAVMLGLDPTSGPGR